MQAIDAIGLSKRYGSVQAVDAITFSVKHGSIFGFLGPNGAGKSTTQRMLTGISKPDSGSVRIMGFDMEHQALQAKQRMGVVPELANVYIDMSAWDNLMFIGEVYGLRKKARAKKAIELLELFDLIEKRDLKAKGFSKGMKQRLLICMALMHDPDVLFLDEPTSGLDVQSTRIIRDLILGFNREGKTVFLTTHDIEEASQLCDFIAIVSHGRLAAIDSPENLKSTFTSLQTVEVVFRPEVRLEGNMIQSERIFSVKHTGSSYLFYTDRPASVISHVVNLAQEMRSEIVSMQTHGPSLEDVFLEITGGLGSKKGVETSV